MAPQGLVKLFLIKNDIENVSAAFCFTLGNTVRVWKTGWSGQHADKHPNHLLWWEVMLWSKRNGFRYIDFVWVDTEDAKRAQRGERSPEGFRDGTSYFKLGFGGKLIFTPSALSLPINPLLKLFFALGGRPILNNHVLIRILAHLRKREKS